MREQDRTASEWCFVTRSFMKNEFKRHVIKVGLIFGLLTEVPANRGSTVVKLLCYKSEVRWFYPSWRQWIFH
jgi:hypothetical protein